MLLPPAKLLVRDLIFFLAGVGAMVLLLGVCGCDMKDYHLTIDPDDIPGNYGDGDGYPPPDSSGVEPDSTDGAANSGWIHRSPDPGAVPGDSTN